MLWPIYVASKGRATTAVLPAIPDYRYAVYVVVEPQDVAAYRAAHPDWYLLPLKENDGGLAVCRQAILDHARRQGYNWYWLIDDDVKGYLDVYDRRVHKAHPAQVLVGAQNLIQQASAIKTLGQGALEHRQLAWCATKPIVFNSYCDGVVAINVVRTMEADYRRETDLKADRDFTLQLRALGLTTMRLTQLAFDCPTMRTNKGGCHEQYLEAGRERHSAEALVRLWPGLCTLVTKKNGVIDAKIRWQDIHHG